MDFSGNIKVSGVTPHLQHSTIQQKVKTQEHMCMNIYINPISAPVCKISRLKDAWTHLKNSLFSGPVTSPLSVMHFDENLLQSQCEKEKGWRILNFHIYWLFSLISNDISAVKGLKECSTCIVLHSGTANNNNNGKTMIIFKRVLDVIIPWYWYFYIFNGAI